MSRKMLINASHPEENRVAIVVDGILSELDIEIAGQQQTKGNIYKAVVVRVETGLQAAFVDYGAERHGFLQIGEIHPNLYPEKKSDSKERPRINDILHRGQEIMVQVVKGERGTKGAALTTLLSLPGRYMVLMPDSNTKGVSRKIQDDKERKTLKKTMAQLDLPEEMGYIVRTAGIGKEETELKRDFNYLVSLYKGILSRREKAKAPAQLYQESDIVIRSIRDYFATDMDEVLIDDSQVYKQARDFFSLVMPEQLKLVKQHREKRPIFSRYQIEEQIDSLSRNQVPLPSGGSIVMDQTEALVAIDVNSGRMAGEKGIEATAARSNIEAAAEIGRQLRLRDLGGLIVIDFIDMRDRKKVREVEQTLRESIKDDKARITTGRISQFGLLEMSRQRIRPTLSVGAYLDCPHCQGKGRIKSPEAQAVALLRQLHASVSKGQIGTIKVNVPLDVANYLLNEQRQALSDLEQRFDLKILIFGSLDAVPGQVELELLKREKIQTDDQDDTPVSHADGLEEALAAENAPEEEKEVTTDETVNNEKAEGEVTSDSPTKKRRRRRRRRRSGSGEPQQSDDSSSESNDEKNVETPDAEQTANAVAPEAEAEPAQDKPRRRGRRPAAKKQEDQATTLAPEETTPEGAAPEEVKPKRRSRRPAAKKTAEPVAETTTESTPAAEVKPKRRTRKTSTARQEIPVVAETTESQAPAEGQTKPKTRRTSTQKPAEVVVEDKAATPLTTEEKPKRRTRRPTVKKQNDQTTAVEPEIAATVEEKPKRRGRRPTAKKTTEAPAENLTGPAVAVEEKPKRRTRKPAAKKPAEPNLKDTATADTSTDEKPKRRPRKPAVKKNNEE